MSTPRDASETGGFSPGFPVKTPTGFKRIEQVQAGELVMSALADGLGPPQPKKVIRTFQRPGRTLITLLTSVPGKDHQYTRITAAGPTPFWVEGSGWTRLDAIARGAQLRTLDGPAVAGIRYPVYRTLEPGIGWIQEFRDLENARGTRFDYANYALIPHNEPVYLDAAIHDSDDRFLHITVHDLQVEDFESYYIGHHWVRGTSRMD